MATTYQINEKYKKLLKTKVDQTVIDTIFNGEFDYRFKDPKETKRICELFLEGKKGVEVAKIIGKSPSTCRDRYNKVLLLYNRFINNIRHEAWKNAVPANLQIFNHNAKLHDVDAELFAKEICKIPSSILEIKDSKEKYDKLLEWFYKEADDGYEYLVLD